MCRCKIIKICKDGAKKQHIRRRTPLILYKQRKREDKACQDRPKTVRLHRYTEQIANLGYD